MNTPPNGQPSDTKVLMQRRKAHFAGSYLFYKAPVEIVRGEGIWLFDRGGRRYLDCYNNVACVGHCHPGVVEALCRQAAILNTHTRYLHPTIIDYSEHLAGTMPDGLNVCLYTCTGTEANELAMRMAKTITGNQGVIVMEHAYHGNSTLMNALSTCLTPPGGCPEDIAMVEPPNTYRGSYRRTQGLGEAEPAEQYGGLIDSAVQRLNDLGHGVAAFICDAIFDSQGTLDAPMNYFKQVYDKIRAAGGLCIADEVQAGFARLGDHMWGFQHYDAVPDIVTLGKPMGAGHPVAGVVTRAEIADTFFNNAFYFNTFGGNPVSAAVAQAVLSIIETEGLQQNARDVGAYLRNALEQLAGRHPLIGDIRGRGLFLGIELVSDQDTLAPAYKETRSIVEAMKNEGILLGAAGRFGNVIKIRPPLVFSRDNADLLADTLDKVLTDFKKGSASGQTTRATPDFYRLPPEVQAERFKKLAAEALKAWNLDRRAELELIKHRENAVFKVTAGGSRYVMRVHRWGYHSDDALHSELQWMEALAQSGIDTPEVIKTRQGDWFTTAAIDEVPEPRQVAMFGWVDGVPISELTETQDETAMHRSIGELMARLHNQAAQWTTPRGFVRHCWDADGLLGDRPVWGQFWELSHFSDDQREKIHRAREIVRRRLHEFGQGNDRYGLIHCDFLPENLLKEGRTVRIIDFDDCGYGWHMFDIATSLFYASYEEDFEAVKNAFIEGYRSRRRLSDEQLKTFDLFLLLRVMTACGWVHTRPETETARHFGPLLAADLAAKVGAFLDNVTDRNQTTTP